MPPFVRPQATPFWTTRDKRVQLYHGHVIDVLKSLSAKSVQCVVTSPPYWGLRNYGAGQEVLWEDGWFGAYGAEPTPDMFVLHTVFIFREVRRVMRDDGTLWLNYGDTYGGGNLVGIPWRVALALQAEGWVLRQDIIWHKPSPMPESVQNRCTKAHEYIFLLTKSERYFYDAEAIKEESTIYKTSGLTNKSRSKRLGTGLESRVDFEPRTTKNKRSVWTVASQGYKGAHFATFPPKLIEPCVLAGTSAYGECIQCGSPFKRVVEKTKLLRERPNEYVKRTGEKGTGNSCSNTVAGISTNTVGWEPICRCGTEATRPCTVLDPFIGSGTTCCVAYKNGLSSIGIDLSEKYLRENAIPRISEAVG